MPRFAYWTILIGNAPTAFRGRTREELVPTLRQIQRRHPEAILRWFARGRVWDSPMEADTSLRQERQAATARRPALRAGGFDRRQKPGPRDRKPRPPAPVGRDTKRSPAAAPRGKRRS
jgi:hypothetical protein